MDPLPFDSLSPPASLDSVFCDGSVAVPGLLQCEAVSSGAPVVRVEATDSDLESGVEAPGSPDLFSSFDSRDDPFHPNYYNPHIDTSFRPIDMNNGYVQEEFLEMDDIAAATGGRVTPTLSEFDEVNVRSDCTLNLTPAQAETEMTHRSVFNIYFNVL